MANRTSECQKFRLTGKGRGRTVADCIILCSISEINPMCRTHSKYNSCGMQKVKDAEENCKFFANFAN